jgi:hypothetical protein
MSPVDLPAFLETFRAVAATFNVRRDEDTLGEVYFKALQPFPLRDVQAGADRCTAFLKRFPKPVEWKEQIPRPTAPGIPELGSFEAADYLEAESCFFEMPPCRCAACVQAGVSMRPIRYMPDEDEVKVRVGARVVLRGHWAHGDELRRWYAAKEAFWAKARSLGYKSQLLNPPDRPAATRKKTRGLVAVADREPGEEG